MRPSENADTSPPTPSIPPPSFGRSASLATAARAASVSSVVYSYIIGARETHYVLENSIYSLANSASFPITIVRAACTQVFLYIHPLWQTTFQYLPIPLVHTLSRKHPFERTHVLLTRPQPRTGDEVLWVLLVVTVRHKHRIHGVDRPRSIRRIRCTVIQPPIFPLTLRGTTETGPALPWRTHRHTA